MAKEYKELCFTDNFMFCKVIANNGELCRHMLELILGKPVRKVEIKTSEKVIDITPQAKSIRMDVYLDDDENTVYDLEMQTSSKKNLPKRLRYYQGVIDLNLIEKGDDYDQLPESVIVFICTFDYFNKNLPFYVFENRCEAMPELLLGDETKKIFVNPYGKRDDLPEDVVYFLDYIRDQKAEDEFTRQLGQAVVKAWIHREWEVEYMNWRAYEMDLNIDKRIAREEGHEEGRKEGREEGYEEGDWKRLIRQVCKKREKGMDPEDAADQLESDLEQVQKLYHIMDSSGTTDVDTIYNKLVDKNVPV